MWLAACGWLAVVDRLAVADQQCSPQATKRSNGAPTAPKVSALCKLTCPSSLPSGHRRSPRSRRVAERARSTTAGSTEVSAMQPWVGPGASLSTASATSAAACRAARRAPLLLPPAAQVRALPPCCCLPSSGSACCAAACC